MGIRARLLILVLAVWLPAAGGFGAFAWRTYANEVEQARRQVEQLGQAIGSVVERELDKRALMARTLASMGAVRDGDVRRFHEEAAGAVSASRDWVVLLDATHHHVNTDAPFPLASVPRVAPAPLTGDAPAVRFVAKGAVTQRPLISVLAGVPGVAVQKYNVAVAFEPAVVQELLSAFTLPLGGVVAIIDQEQRVMARSRDPARWLGLGATGDVRQRAAAGASGFAPSVTLDGVPSLTYLSPPNAYGWAVVVGMPRAGLQATATRVTTQALTAAGVLLTIGLALALFGAQGISNIVGALRRAAGDLGGGRLPERLRSGLREVDEVSDALHEAGARIQRASHDLERQVEQAVEQARQAQAKLLEGQRHEAIGRLTGGIAHDFNNLLQTISTAHHLLGRQLPEGPQRKALEGAVRATSKAGDLVRQLLTFGRAQQLAPTAVALGDVLLNMQELTSKAVGERIELTASVESGLAPLFVDPTQFELALLNLVFNARDAIDGQGRIVITGRPATADETAHLGAGRFVRIEVADTGMGMTDEVRARVFEPYFTTKPVGAGSGLGLAQVEGFVRQSGGDIGLTSRPGHGTTVALTLPAAAMAPSAPTPAPPLHQAGDALAVLMVEDDVLVSSLVVSALQAEGHQVTLCHTADEAVALLQGGGAFDILFTDVVMPGRMNGMDLVKWCRTHRPELPALVATGYAERLSDVPVRVLRKPYDLDALLAALQDVHAAG